MINVIVPVSMLILLSGLYCYMLSRMKVLVVGRKIAAPNPLKSLIEIFAFLAVYAGCAVLASLPDLEITFILTMTILGFFISLLTFNYKMYKSMGSNAAYMSVAIIFCVYVIGFFVR